MFYCFVGDPIVKDSEFVEAGRRGGETVKERYGTPFFQTIGRMGAEKGAQKGGKARKKDLGPEGYAELGRMGGKAVVEKLGREHMREIGRKGGAARVAQSRAIEPERAACSEGLPIRAGKSDLESPSKPRHKTLSEAGKKGGEKVKRERGPDFYSEIGRKGGRRVADTHGSEFYAEIGKKGGESKRSPES